MGISDETLLKRWAARRDAEAFSELVRRHSAMVYGTCLRMLHNAADAEDVAQECFLSLVRLASSERRLPRSLGGWLHTVALRRALDRLRSEGRNRHREERFAAAFEPVCEIPANDLLEWVDEAIANLPNDVRDVTVSHFLEGKTHRQIAAELGVARRTVSSRIAKGIAELRAYLRRHGVLVGVTTLTSVLVAESATAAPARLTASLGKFALSGANGMPAALPSASLAGWGGLIMISKKLAVVLVIALLLLMATWYGGRKIISVSDRGTQAGPGDEVAKATAHRTSPSPDTEQFAAREKSLEVADVSGDSVKPRAQETPALSPEQRVPNEKAVLPIQTPLAAAVLEGTVTVDGQPLADERVQLVYAEGSTPINTRTNADGAFNVAGLEAGKVNVVVGFFDESNQFRYATQWALLDSGSTTKVNFEFLRAGALEGRVLIDGMAPAKGLISVQVQQDAGAIENYDGRTVEDGGFRFASVSEGLASVKVTATAANGVQRVKMASTTVQAGTTARLNFDIMSKEGGSITGRVFGLNAGESCLVHALPPYYEVPPRLSLPLYKDMAAQSFAQCTPDTTAGTFRLDGLDTGEYTVVAIAVTGKSAEDVLDWRIATTPVTVKDDGESHADFDLSGITGVMPALSGTFSGVTEDERVCMAVVDGDALLPDVIDSNTLAPLFDRPVAMIQITAGSSFAFRRLQPGSYTLLAISVSPESDRITGFSNTSLRIIDNQPETLDIHLDRLDDNGRRPVTESSE